MADLPKKEADKPVTIPDYGVFVIPHASNIYSRSCRAIAEAFGGNRRMAVLPPDATAEIAVINWGDAGFAMPTWAKKGSKLYNLPVAINLTRNKLKFFERCKSADGGPRIPEYYTTLEAAIEANNNGIVVLGRKATGSCGTDIVTLAEDIGQFNGSDFWVAYKKKKAEFRIHLFKFPEGITVVDKQQKVLRKTHPQTGEPIDKNSVNFMIRNHRNGFIFQRNEIEVPEDVLTQAVRAFSLSGLDFGAVDVIWNEHERKAYVLEINTAPGLEGTTLDNYVSAFARLGIKKTKPFPNRFLANPAPSKRGLKKTSFTFSY